jgi:serralysin
MALIRLTEQDDTYDHAAGKEWSDIKGLGGNDVIFIHGNGKVTGGPGNDVITNDVFSGIAGGAAYSGSPKAIYVDLEAGYALDGYGTRDTLVNIRDLNTSGQDGDVIFGSSKSDWIWVEGFDWKSRSPGKAMLDLRGGIDTVGFWNVKVTDIRIEVSADARVVNLFGKNGYTATLKNVEALNFREFLENGLQVSTSFAVTDLIDLQSAAPSIILKGNKGWQSNAIGSPTSITYSFFNHAPTLGSEGGTGFSAFTSVQQQTIRDIFFVLQNQTGLTFSEVTGDSGQIRFGINQQKNTKGYSFIPDEFKNDARAGDVWLDQETAAVMTPGQEGYYVLLHELGHALGLQHPLPESDTSGATVLLNSFATTSNTLMLELNASDPLDSWPSWFGSFDVQALRYLYGKREFAAGNDTYTVRDSSSNLTIVDDGGIDTLDVSSVSMSAWVDLRDGKASSIGMDTDGTSKFKNVVITNGSYIENVIGSPYDDVIIGNLQNNLITFTGGSDIVDGQGGVDIVRFSSKSTEFKVSQENTTGYWNAEATNNMSGSIELRNVERLVFSDTSWAIDFGESQNASITAKILGAVFGKDSLSNKNYVGIGLSFLDSGWTYDNLAGLALDAAGAKTNDQIVSLLWTNVIGTKPTAADKQPFISLLENGMTAGALAHLAADSSFNTTNINLVGLAQTGIAFIPMS